MSLRRRLQQLRKAASEGAVLIHQHDGSVRAFDKMAVAGEVFLARLDRALGREPRDSVILDALENATPECRQAIEERFTSKFLKDLEPSAEPVPDLSES